MPRQRMALRVEYPVMLTELAAPKLRVYPRYTVVAEKFEALSLGITSSRMKDYFDLRILAQHTDFDGGNRLKPQLLRETGRALSPV